MIGNHVPIWRLGAVTGTALGPATFPATAEHTAQPSSASGPICRCDAAIETRTAKHNAVNAVTQRRDVECFDVMANMRKRTMGRL